MFPGCYVEIHLFLVIFFFFLYVLDIDVTRNGNNLKLKVKSEFSLSMGLMVINHSIHSTTVLCDNNDVIAELHGDPIVIQCNTLEQT